MWLKEGDRNSKFFHASAKNKRKINRINFLHNNMGHIVEWGSGHEDTMVEYFLNLFAASNTELSTVIDCMQKKVTVEQNENMLIQVEDMEVKEALFNMYPEKSPGPDGMSPGFYQKHWHIVGKDIILTVRNFFDTGHIDSQLTNTNIVLIPKKKNPAFMTDLRPISLCNVVYKIISKVLANMLEQVIDGIIADTQSAFIPGRLIMDSIMVGYEVMHFLKRKMKGNIGWMALMLDINKVYDKVKWDFLEATLIKLGFEDKLTKLFMACMTSA